MKPTQDGLSLSDETQSLAGAVQVTQGKPQGLDADGMCDDHGAFGCKTCVDAFLRTQPTQQPGADHVEQCDRDAWERYGPAIFNCEMTGPEALAAHRLLGQQQGARGMQWQPIETAPRDGSDLIGHRADQGEFSFRWALAEEIVPKDQNGDPAEDYDDTQAGWWHDVWGWLEGDETPTLWQPYPAPPASLPEEG